MSKEIKELVEQVAKLTKEIERLREAAKIGIWDKRRPWRPWDQPPFIPPQPFWWEHDTTPYRQPIIMWSVCESSELVQADAEPGQLPTT